MTEQFKCEYPGCKKEHKYRQTFQLVNEENSCVDLPFCEYHYLIVMGGHFKAKIIKGEKDNEFELIGPLHEVEIAEQVMAARELTKKKK